MKSILEFLKGKKTYIIAFAAAIYGTGIDQGLWPHYPGLDLILAALGAATLRAGIAKSATLSMLLAAAILSTGCATVETNAYRTVGTTTALVDAAMNGWGDYVRAGNATDAEQQQVRAAYEKYQRSLAVVRVAVRSYKSAPSDASDLNRVLQVFSDTASDLLDLVKPLILNQ